MIKLISQNKYSFFFLFLIFIYFNVRIILNFGLYNDDWLFYTKGNKDLVDWAITVWRGEGIWIRRHVAVPFYIFFHSLPVSFLYIFSFILSLIIFYLIFVVFNKILFNNYYYKNNSDFYLSTTLLTLSWYFFPFNVGGQFWITAIIHTKLATVFFFVHLILLVNKRFFLSLIFLILCFNSYEIYFFLYLPIVLIFFYQKKIEKNVLSQYLFYTAIIQVFFLVDKKRNEHVIDFLNIFYYFFENIPRFFWSIYSSVPENFNSILKIVLFIIFFFIITIIINNFITENKSEKKFKIISLICISFSLAFNSLVHVIGTYGYWGKGIFSRTMYVPSLLILFVLIIFVSTLKKKLNLIVSFIIFFITIFFFNIEITNWEKAKKIQDEIVSNYLSNKENILLSKKKKLILFFGPCYYNGVEIFTATYDMQNAILYKSKNFGESNVIVPIQNWKIENINNSSFKIHLQNYQTKDFDSIYLWNYFNEKRSKIISTDSDAMNVVKQILYMRDNQDCSIGTNENLRANKARKTVYSIF
jgi:hypothetical protein